MSTQRTVRVCVGRLPQTDLSDFWEIGLDVQNPSVPNLPLLTPAAGGFTGNLSVTLGAATLSATGIVDVQGTSAVTLGVVTSSAVGKVDVVGTLASTLGLLTATGQAQVEEQGVLNSILVALTASAAGTIAVFGTLERT